MEQRPKMAQHMIDITSDDIMKKQEYGCLIPLNDFIGVNAIPDQPAAAAAKFDDNKEDMSTDL
jgi:hypothetical protein